MRKFVALSYNRQLSHVNVVLERVAASGKMMTKLEHFEVFINHLSDAVQFLPKLFMTPKPLLREIVFRGYNSTGPLGDILCDLADVVSALEVLRFLDVNVTAGEIERLVLGNPGLTTVEVEFSFGTLARVKFSSHDGHDELHDEREERYVLPAPHVEAAVQFIDVLCKCNALKEMVISDITLNELPKSKRISESCRAFRGKDVDIFVGGVQYIP